MTAEAWAEDVESLAARHDGLTAELAGIESAIEWTSARLRDCGAMTDAGGWVRRRGQDRATAGPDGWDSEDSYLRLVADWRGLTAERKRLRAEIADLAAILESAPVPEPAAAVAVLADVPADVPAVRTARTPRRRPRPMRRPLRRATAPPAWTWLVPADVPVSVPEPAAVPAPVVSAVPAGRPLAEWAPARQIPGRRDPVRGRLLAGLLSALLCLAGASLVTFGLGDPAPLGLLAAFAAWLLSIAISTQTHGRIAATINNGRTPAWISRLSA